MASIKVLRKIHAANERESLVKDLIALRPISPVETKKSHPYQVLYDDPNPPPPPIDQFAPYLSRKLMMKRAQRIEKIRTKKKGNEEDKTFLLTGAPNAQVPAPAPAEGANLPMLSETSKPAGSHGRTSTLQLTTHKPANHPSLERHLRMEQTFDQIVSGSATSPLHRLVETTLQMYFLAEKVLFLHDISSVKILYCPTTTTYCPHGTGLAGFVQFTRKISIVPEAGTHISYSLEREGNQVPPDSQLLMWPIFDGFNNVKGVIIVARGKSQPAFTEDDRAFAEYFQEKCRSYARWLFQPSVNDSVVSDLIRACRVRQFAENVNEKLTQVFSCRSAELWKYDKGKEEISKYSVTSDKPVVLSASETGMAGFVLKQAIPVSCISSRVHSAYNEKTDGNGEHSFLAIPVRDPDNPVLYAVVLRGKRTPQFFTDNDEKILARLIPYVISGLNSAEMLEKNHRALKDSMHQQKRLRSLLEVAETLSGQLKMDVLIPNIMKRACELVKSDRCSLFMVNESHDRLVSFFQGGLANAIEIPINAGIVGFTATTGEVLNIKDAYDDPRFNRATDLKTGYRTLTILCAPIFDETRQICGVTEMINKLEGVFTEEDEKMLKIFNVFCGISLENARLYKASIELSLQLRSFLDISHSMAQPQAIKKLITEILQNSRKVIGAMRAALFMIEDNGIQFTPYVLDEDSEVAVRKMQQRKQDEAEDSLGVKRAIIARLLQGKSTEYDAEAEKDEEERNKLIEHAISHKESLLENNQEKPEMSLIIVPLISSDRAVMGAVMMQWKKNGQRFTLDEQKLIESYSVFLSMSLERSRLKTMAQLGSVEVEMQGIVTTEERTLCAVPEKLIFSGDDASVVFSIDFDSTRFKGLGLIKTAFAVFEKLELISTFQISAEMLCHFLFNMRDTYNAVAYHNWNHAIDSMQYLAHVLVNTNLHMIFTKFEMLAMVTAMICHDASHDGFSSNFNVKAQTPLGILFKNQSVMETHHCSVAIGILTKDEANLFHTLDDAELSKMWKLFVDLILATDMSKHFTIVERATEILSGKKPWELREETRLIAMEMMVKCADLSIVSRCFEIADRSCDIVGEEFFRQGDLSKAEGIEGDRETLNREKSQIGFLKSVCLPTFDTMAKFTQGLENRVSQVRNNIYRWEERKKQKELDDKKRAEEEAVVRAEREAIEAAKQAEAELAKSDDDSEE